MKSSNLPRPMILTAAIVAGRLISTAAKPSSQGAKPQQAKAMTAGQTAATAPNDHQGVCGSPNSARSASTTATTIETSTQRRTIERDSDLARESGSVADMPSSATAAFGADNPAARINFADKFW